MKKHILIYSAIALFVLMVLMAILLNYSKKHFIPLSVIFYPHIHNCSKLGERAEIFKKSYGRYPTYEDINSGKFSFIGGEPYYHCPNGEYYICSFLYDDDNHFRSVSYDSRNGKWIIKRVIK